MRKQRRRAPWALALTLIFACLALAPTAQAKLVGEFTKFQYCPWKEAEVFKCIYSVTTGGEVKLGSKAVPIEKSVLLQGGYAGPDEKTNISKFYGATNGITLQKVPQSVPGGLAGVVPDASSPTLVKKLIKFFFENSITGLNSTLELAKPASEIQISEFNLSHREGVALKLPIKVRLENPFLGSKCYIGSSTSPVYWNLTSGVTSPPAPNTKIEGDVGEASFLEEGLIFRLKNSKLVDNAWSAPSVTGCGGILSFLVNPIVSSQLGSTAAGRNTAILINTIDLVSVPALEYIDAENP